MGWATKYPNSWWFPGASNTLWEGAYTVKKIQSQKVFGAPGIYHSFSNRYWNCHLAGILYPSFSQIVDKATQNGDVSSAFLYRMLQSFEGRYEYLLVHRSSQFKTPFTQQEYHGISLYTQVFLHQNVKRNRSNPKVPITKAPRPKERWLKAAAAALTSFSPKAWGFMDWKHLSNWGTNHWGIEPSILRHFLVEYSGM